MGEPIRVAVLDQDKAGAWATHELTHNDIREHENAVDAAYDALKNWRDSFHSEKAEQELPAKPEPPSGEVKDLKRQMRDMKELVAELSLENRLLKKSMIADGGDEE